MVQYMNLGGHGHLYDGIMKVETHQNGIFKAATITLGRRGKMTFKEAHIILRMLDSITSIKEIIFFIKSLPMKKTPNQMASLINSPKQLKKE